MNAINYYLPDRDDVTARVESTVRIKGAEPIQFTDYLYANDGAGSVMGAVRGLRVLVPLLMNPYAPVDDRARRASRSTSGSRRTTATSRRSGCPPAIWCPASATRVQVLMSTWDGKDVIEDVPVDVPQSLAGSIVHLEVTAGDSAKLDAAPPVDLPSLMAAFRKLLPGTSGR